MSRSSLDRYSEDISVMNKNEQDVVNLLSERKALAGKGGQTGIVIFECVIKLQMDYQLKSRIETLKAGLKDLEKTAYLYEKDPTKFTEL